ncbi:ATPase, FliI/YscN family [Desulfurobacterium thermolithotrophum DSM 11699]|uniref:ATPase, FliI/YscN family n=1 Tax=Desulfurobacterium thermolithotrophum (strain DSM 11699 / BSA) TaxID=868864 RepID=F0S0R7_DESTD|nr:FliI/YscN family ATPase [Desulfurobacterium thermolithotrophum]ADY73870.1 ATPase, FliI/YscN family [Desulfurobacterium thermolithotrophum DSM 11699]
MKERLKSLPKYRVIGKVSGVRGPIVEAKLPKVHIGDFCTIDNTIEAEVVGFKEGKTLLMAYSDTTGISLGSIIESKISGLKIGVSDSLLGLVLDPFGNPMNAESFVPIDFVPLKAEPINPMKRKRIKEPLDLGVRAINALLTVGKGQRIGIFAGAGVGKSTLMGMISRFTEADVNVVALIGERGREVREFIEDNLGEEGLKKSVIVVATSDHPPLAKIRAAFTACAIAEYFSYKGKNVLLFVDSLTRLAMAQREIGLAVGEPPTSKGYTPSVFSTMAKLIERAGNFTDGGSITGIYTVLVEGDDISLDPVADAAVGFLDGHIILSRELANRRVFPSIDIIKSISRLTPQLVNEEVLKYQSIVLDVESTYQNNSDVINLGLYKKGTSPKIDLAIKVYPAIENFIKQSFNEKVTFSQSLKELKSLVEYIKIEGDHYGYRWNNK